MSNHIPKFDTWEGSRVRDKTTTCFAFNLRCRQGSLKICCFASGLASPRLADQERIDLSFSLSIMQRCANIQILQETDPTDSDSNPSVKTTHMPGILPEAPAAFSTVVRQ
jgi:hypothetical protein